MKGLRAGAARRLLALLVLAAGRTPAALPRRLLAARFGSLNKYNW